jgi:hypothetical protein
LTIPSVGTWPLEDGEFTFILQNTPIGDLHTVVKGSSWTSYSAVFSINSPGTYTLGIHNTKMAPYFVNFDSFTVQSVPEPSTMVLLATVAASLLFMVGRRQRKGETP